MALLLTIATTRVEATHITCSRSMLLFCQQERNRLSIIEQNGVKICHLLGCTEMGSRIAMRALTLLALSTAEVASAKLIESGAVLEIGRLIGIKIDGSKDSPDDSEGSDDNKYRART